MCFLAGIITEVKKHEDNGFPIVCLCRRLHSQLRHLEIPNKAVLRRTILPDWHIVMFVFIIIKGMLLQTMYRQTDGEMPHDVRFFCSFQCEVCQLCMSPKSRAEVCPAFKLSLTHIILASLNKVAATLVSEVVLDSRLSLLSRPLSFVFPFGFTLSCFQAVSVCGRRLLFHPN